MNHVSGASFSRLRDSPRTTMRGHRRPAALLNGTRTLAVSPLPPVTPLIRERIAREFDDRGPDACMVEVADDLTRNNPELLDMAAKCANSLGDYRRIMVGFGMFYRLLLAPASPGDDRSRSSAREAVTPQTRHTI